MPYQKITSNVTIKIILYTIMCLREAPWSNGQSGSVMVQKVAVSWVQLMKGGAYPSPFAVLSFPNSKNGTHLLLG